MASSLQVLVRASAYAEGLGSGPTCHPFARRMHARTQFGHQYMLGYEDSAEEPTYVVLRDTLKRLGSEFGLESLPEELGELNFHDVALYIGACSACALVWIARLHQYREGELVFGKISDRKGKGRVTGTPLAGRNATSFSQDR